MFILSQRNGLYSTPRPSWTTRSPPSLPSQDAWQWRTPASSQTSTTSEKTTLSAANQFPTRGTVPSPTLSPQWPPSPTESAFRPKESPTPSDLPKWSYPATKSTTTNGKKLSNLLNYKHYINSQGGAVTTVLDYARRNGLVDEDCFSYQADPEIPCPANLQQCNRYKIQDYCVVQ